MTDIDKTNTKHTNFIITFFKNNKNICIKQKQLISLQINVICNNHIKYITMSKYFITLFMLALTITTIAQNQMYNLWYFGGYSGLDFSNGDPIAIAGGQITGLEGCATICNDQGDLLFYTDGQKVYNSNHEVMENGDNLMGHWSSAQSALILPVLSQLPRNQGKLYYIFTTDDSAEQHLSDGWRYSIVDMSLDGGLGAITNYKNILLCEMVTERQVAIPHSNNQDIWIVGHRWNSNEFIAYLITNQGISATPVVSAIGPVNQGGWSPNPVYNGWINAAGFIKTNLAGDKIAVTQHDLGQFEVYDFDNSTGIISNYRASQSFPRAYGIEFSPDGSKLYGTYDIYTNSSKVIQFDLDVENPLENYAVVGSCSRASGLQLAINGKIYVARTGSSFLAEISNPNESGVDCGFNANAIDLVYTESEAGLPSMYYYPGFMVNDENINTDIRASVYPNPCIENLTIEYDGEFNVKIYNSKGQLVTSLMNQYEQCVINSSKYKNGLYLINIISEDGKKQTYRIVKL